MTVTVCLTFDFDAMSSWIYGYRTKSPNALSRGEFGAVGAQRLIRLLEERDMPSTWFVPGHSAEAFPDVIESLLEHGHGIGHHGYCHEDPSHMERDEELSVLERGIDVLVDMTGAAPTGYRCPSGSFSEHTLGFLLDHGFRYDSSMMADDFTPYYCRVGDQVAVDKPFVFGEPINIVDYHEHSLATGSDAQAICLLAIDNGEGGRCYGVGVSRNTITASLNGVISALNRRWKPSRS